jgi:type IV pilus assembly protein PilQ
VAVLLHTSGSVKYAASLIDTPHRLVIDLEPTTYGWRKTPLTVSTEPVKQIRASQFRKGVTRVVLELSRKAAYRIEEGEAGITVTLEGAAVTPDAPRSPAKRAGASAEPPRALAPMSHALSVEIPTAEPQSKPVKNQPIRIAQAAPQPPAGPRLISLDFKDADVANLLRILAAESGKNIVAGDDVKGKVSVSLKNVTWELALDTILESRGLQKIEKDNVIRIVSTEQLAKEREAKAKLEEAKIKAEAEIRAKIAEAQLKEQEVQQRKLAAEAAQAEAQARGPLKEETIRLKYADPEEVAKTLQGILGIPPEGAQVPATPITPGPPPIAEPPFSALYGPAAQQPPRPPVVSPTQEVLAKGITIRAHKPTNSIFIRHYEADLERIKTLIQEKLDIPLPQVKIEARMDILDRTALEQIGVQWGGAAAGTESTNELTLVGTGFSPVTGTGIGIPANFPRFNQNLTLTQLLPVSALTGLPLGGNMVNLPTTNLPTGTASPAGGFSFGIIGSTINVNLMLQALETQGKTRTLARPEVVTVENNKALMSLGEEIPYATISSAGTQIQFKEALLKLEVTPTVIREAGFNRIKMKIVVENNSRGDVVNLGSAGQPPAINKRKAETEVLIKEGERLVIGGVTTDVAATTLRFVPLLGRIPFLGWLFKSREFSDSGRELVIFVTPHVLGNQAQPPAKPQAKPEAK